VQTKREFTGDLILSRDIKRIITFVGVSLLVFTHQWRQVCVHGLGFIVASLTSFYFVVIFRKSNLTMHHPDVPKCKEFLKTLWAKEGGEPLTQFTDRQNYCNTSLLFLSTCWSVLK
jgi:hypothetical protein